MAEIKPLEHWRRLDEVLLAADMLPLEEKAPRPARAPFPARALRDRPWDISALVEE